MADLPKLPKLPRFPDYTREAAVPPVPNLVPKVQGPYGVNQGRFGPFSTRVK